MKNKPKMVNGAYEVTVYLRAKVGDRVYVENYRMNPSEWEPGVVVDVDFSVNKDLHTDASYRVMLDRESNPNKYTGLTNKLFLQVGDHQIEKIDG